MFTVIKKAARSRLMERENFVYEKAGRVGTRKLYVRNMLVRGKNIYETFQL